MIRVEGTYFQFNLFLYFVWLPVMLYVFVPILMQLLLRLGAVMFRFNMLY